MNTIDTTSGNSLPLSEADNKMWWKNSESEQILNRGYLLKGETVEGAIDRICTAAARRLYKPELKDSFVEMIERGWMSISSPVWANMGTERGLPISCFNVHVPDEIEAVSYTHLRAHETRIGISC